MVKLDENKTKLNKGGVIDVLHIQCLVPLHTVFMAPLYVYNVFLCKKVSLLFPNCTLYIIL